MFRKASRALALGVAVIAGSLGVARADTEINMTGFGGATNLPVWVALDKGLFKKEGLSVTLDRTQGSAPQIKDTMEGKYQFITSAFDNIVAYTEGDGATQYPDFDIVAILGVHSGLNSVVARPEVKDYAAIKGKAVSVDALTSGYATVLYQILADRGLTRDKEYKVISVGGTDARVKSLKDGSAAAAVISSLDDIQLQKEGYNILGDAAAAIGNYQGSVYSLRRSWAKTHDQEVMALTRAIIAAHDYVFANREGAIEVLKKHTKGLTDQELSELYERLTGPGGLHKGAAINMKGVETVLKLRSIYGGGKSSLMNPLKYVDLSYSERAHQEK